jgi:hypothetical protein
MEAEVHRITAQLEQQQAQNATLHNNIQMSAATLGQVRAPTTPPDARLEFRERPQELHGSL